MDHNDRQDFHRDVKVGSDRSFGLVFTVVFMLIGAWPLIKGADPRLWSLGLAGAFLLIALISPQLLRPLNLLWFKVGIAIGRVMTPIVMGMLYVTTIVPIGIIFKITGKDPLRLKRDPNATSYWIKREPPGPEPKSLKNQF